MTGALIHVRGAEPGQVRGALSPLANLARARPRLDVELVIQGPVVAHVVESSSLCAEILAAAQEAGGTTLLCGHSLQSAGIPPDAVPEGLGVVDSAVAHLVDRQLSGWVYLRL